MGLLVLCALFLVGFSSGRLHHDHGHGPGSSHGSELQFLHLPVIPPALPTIETNKSYDKLIPRKLWIAIKDRNDPLPPHLKALFERNPDWEVSMCDNACKDAFMQNEFANTSVSAVYNLIHPLIGAARADIWRYAVLYTYGGVYLDDDSDIRTPLDQVSAECCTERCMEWHDIHVVCTNVPWGESNDCRSSPQKIA